MKKKEILLRKKVIKECLEAIGKEYLPGDFSEYTRGLRQAKIAIKKKVLDNE